MTIDCTLTVMMVLLLVLITLLDVRTNKMKDKINALDLLVKKLEKGCSGMFPVGKSCGWGEQISHRNAIGIWEHYECDENGDWNRKEQK